MDTSLFAAPTIRSLFDTLLTEGARVFEMNNVTVTLETSLRDYYPNEYHDNEKSHFINSDRVSFLPVDDMENYFGDEMEPLLAGNVRRGTTLFSQMDFQKGPRRSFGATSQRAKAYRCCCFRKLRSSEVCRRLFWKILNSSCQNNHPKGRASSFPRGPSFSGEVNAA